MKKKKHICEDEQCACDCHEDKECNDVKDNCECSDDKCTHDNNCNCNEDNCDCHDQNCDCGDECDCNCEDEDCGCEHEDISQDALGYLELAQRIQADFENYKRRNAEIEKTSFNNGVYAMISKLLPVMDSFKQARATIKDQSALEGLEIIHSQIIKAMASFGVHKIECVGQKFDPNLHNAVMTDCDETKEDEVVLEELQEGFKSDSKVIRHSVVKINRL